MNASSIKTIGTVVLTMLLLSGCKRPASGVLSAETNTAPAGTNATSAMDANAAPATNNPPPVVQFRGKDLGVIQLTNRCETRIQVGDGKTCAITPQLLDAQRLRLTMTLESKLADGKTRGLKIMTLVTKPNQPFEVDFGSLVFALTPQMAPPPAPAP